MKGPLDRIKDLGQAMTVTVEREAAHARLLALVAEIERGQSADALDLLAAALALQEGRYCREALALLERLPPLDEGSYAHELAAITRLTVCTYMNDRQAATRALAEPRFRRAPRSLALPVGTSKRWRPASSRRRPPGPVAVPEV